MEAAELTALLREVRDRVRARFPQGSAGPEQVPLADLMPLVHARDSAEAKVAAIGTVNPRPPGPVNSIVQAIKRTVARALDWHVREQVEFNRNVVACVNANIEAMNDLNRSLVAVGERLGVVREEMAGLRAEAEELKDIRSYWHQWHTGWEQKIATNEIQFLRSVADLQAAFQHRASLMEAGFREQLRSQHANFEGALERSTLDIQKRLWADLQKFRVEYERLIHSELRVIRQKGFSSPAGAVQSSQSQQTQSQPPPDIDQFKFADRFRGSEERVRDNQRFYLRWFTGRREVLDIGCGRGEFLEVMREAGMQARGIDLSEEAVRYCQGNGFEAQRADLFEYLDNLPDGSLDGIFCAQVVEHLAPERLPEMIRLAARKLEIGGVIAIETPNPECLAIFATHFYIDPTHTRPVPPQLLAFYLEENGVGGLEVHRLAPAVESMPALASLPSEFREAFFGALDYAIVGRKL